MPSPPTDRIRILLVDKHALVRAGLRMLIESQPGLAIVGEASNFTDAIAIAAREHPDVILLEPDEDDRTLECIPQLIAAAKSARVILVTDKCDPQVHQQAIQSGVIGIVLKDQPADVLIKAITKVHAGQAWIDRSMTADVLATLSRARIEEEADPETEKVAGLSAREREIIALLGQGLKNKQIAERLCISEITVRHYLTSVFSKLGISDRLELAIYAYQQGLAQLPR